MTPNLEFIALDHNEIMEIGVGILGSLQDLKEFRINDNPCFSEQRDPTDLQTIQFFMIDSYSITTERERPDHDEETIIPDDDEGFMMSPRMCRAKYGDMGDFYANSESEIDENFETDHEKEFEVTVETENGEFFDNVKDTLEIIIHLDDS